MICTQFVSQTGTRWILRWNCKSCDNERMHRGNFAFATFEWNPTACTSFPGSDDAHDSFESCEILLSINAMTRGGRVNWIFCLIIHDRFYNFRRRRFFLIMIALSFCFGQWLSEDLSFCFVNHPIQNFPQFQKNPLRIISSRVRDTFYYDFWFEHYFVIKNICATVQAAGHDYKINENLVKTKILSSIIFYDSTGLNF